MLHIARVENITNPFEEAREIASQASLLMSEVPQKGLDLSSFESAAKTAGLEPEIVCRALPVIECFAKNSFDSPDSHPAQNPFQEVPVGELTAATESPEIRQWTLEVYRSGMYLWYLDQKGGGLRPHSSLVIFRPYDFVVKMTREKDTVGDHGLSVLTVKISPIGCLPELNGGRMSEQGEIRTTFLVNPLSGRMTCEVYGEGRIQR